MCFNFCYINFTSFTWVFSTFRAVYPFEDCWFFVTHRDWTGQAQKAQKFVCDFRTAEKFFGSSFTLEKVTSIIEQRNQEWNQKNSKKAKKVIFKKPLYYNFLRFNVLFFLFYSRMILENLQSMFTLHWAVINIKTPATDLNRPTLFCPSTITNSSLNK